MWTKTVKTNLELFERRTLKQTKIWFLWASRAKTN